MASRSIEINYADCKVAQVKRASVKALFRNEDILLVGEGNFTFTVALAAIRGGSWNGIVSTRYEAETSDNPRPQFAQVKLKCIEFCRTNGKLLGIDDETIKEYVDAVKGVDPPPKEEHKQDSKEEHEEEHKEKNWLFGIDATNTPEYLTVKGTVVVFQCPWLPGRDPNGTPATLITSFLEHMSTKQNVGDYVLIGITKQFPYVKSYKLKDLLGDDLSNATDSSGKYNFLGADDTFVQEILKHGYHHQSCHRKEIHEDIINDHVTLVFQRKGRIPKI